GRPGRFGRGPCGLDADRVPLPLATYSRLSAGLKRTDVGYQPTGMKPSGWALPRSATLKTATLLLSALATNSIWPAGVRHRLLGGLPTAAAGYSAQAIVSRPLPVSASRTLTRVELAQATNSVLPSGARVISVGCFSVGQAATGFFWSRSMTATAAWFHRLTNSRLPSAAGRQA